MCMKHSDCPKGYPICMPGPYTKEILLNDDEDNSFFIGMKFTFQSNSKNHIFSSIFLIENTF